MGNNNLKSKKIWFKKINKNNYDNRYFDKFIISNTKITLVFITLNDDGFYKTKTTSNYESFNIALRKLEEKTNILINIFGTNELMEIIKKANEELNENEYFAINN